jgi:hypothetical protein
VADKYSILEIELPTNLHHIVGITVERSVFLRVVSRDIGLAGTNMIEQHGLEPIFEGRRYETPHILVTAITVGKHHDAIPVAFDNDIIANESWQDMSSARSADSGELRAPYLTPEHGQGFHQRRSLAARQLSGHRQTTVDIREPYL